MSTPIEQFQASLSSLDDALNRADSTWNMVQHEAVKPFRDVEQDLVEGFRAGVEARDEEQVQRAADLMADLASRARRLLLNPDGSVKSQAWDAAAEEAKNIGDDFKDAGAAVASTLGALKWVAIGGAVLAVVVIIVVAVRAVRA